MQPGSSFIFKGGFYDKGAGHGMNADMYVSQGSVRIRKERYGIDYEFSRSEVARIKFKAVYIPFRRYLHFELASGQTAPIFFRPYHKEEAIETLTSNGWPIDR